MSDQGEETDISQVNVEDLRGRAACLERLKDRFWRWWRDEYLLELRNSHRIRTNPTQGALVRVGDIVIIHEDGLQRGLWNLRRVERLISRKDGIVRGAVVMPTTKQERSTMLRRPLQKLYPAEYGTHRVEVPVTDAPVAPSRGADARQRPRRATVCRADSNRRLLIQNHAL